MSDSRGLHRGLSDGRRHASTTPAAPCLPNNPPMANPQSVTVEPGHPHAGHPDRQRSRGLSAGLCGDEPAGPRHAFRHRPVSSLHLGFQLHRTGQFHLQGDGQRGPGVQRHHRHHGRIPPAVTDSRFMNRSIIRQARLERQKRSYRGRSQPDMGGQRLRPGGRRLARLRLARRPSAELDRKPERRQQQLRRHPRHQRVGAGRPTACSTTAPPSGSASSWDTAPVAI